MKRSRARVWVAILLVLAVALAALAAYLWVVNAQWQEQNDQLRTDVADLGAQVTETDAQVLALESDLADAQVNLDGATGTVTDLADASANAKDEAAFLSELAESFRECSEAQANHISHLQNASRYTASSLAAEGRDVEQFCDGVATTYDDFLTDRG
ncbi:hypothetical protein [Demequina aurantiaca]|uniref:hypothetical protein n=1 Tax=Demequina aurantiaca TaxID=676200 RepID=UPI003D3269B9